MAKVGQVDDIEPEVHVRQQQLQLAHERVHLVLPCAPHMGDEGVEVLLGRQRELGLGAGDAQPDGGARARDDDLAPDGRERRHEHDGLHVGRGVPR